MKNSLTPGISLLILFFMISGHEALAQKKKPSDYGIKSRKALKKFQEGQEYDRYRDRGKAISLYQEAIAIEPDFAHAHYNLGTDYYVLRSYEEALPHLEKAYELMPETFTSAPFLLGEVYFLNEQYEKARNYIKDFLDRGIGRSQDLEIAESRLKHAIYAAEAYKDSVTFDPQNMGPNVNSVGDETHPFLTADGQTLLFTGNRPESFGRSPNEDLFLSKFEEKAFAVAENMGTVINDRRNQGAASITQDGQRIIFTACNQEDGYGSCDLYTAYRVGNKWSEPQNLGPLVNTRFWESYPTLSDDGKTLFFSSTRLDGVGARDIWYCRWDGENWGPAQNMGTPINSPGDEVAPFLHADGESFYFASTYHPGFGRADIFVSYKNEDGSWQEPKNLGYPLNSSAEDQGIFIAVNGKQAFYASNRDGGFGGSDIYQFEMPEPVRPRIATFLRGTVVDSFTQKPLVATIRLQDLTSGDTIRQVNSDRITGNFLASLPLDRQYAAYVESKGYLFKTQNFTLIDLESEAYFDLILEMVPLEEGSQAVLDNIFFEFGSYKLKEASKVELDFLYNYMKQNPGMEIEIQGHTDNVGTPEANFELSQQRAEAVRTYLLDRGIEPSRISAKGYGETRPVAGNITDEDRARNRRTEFKVLKMR